MENVVKNPSTSTKTVLSIAAGVLMLVFAGCALFSNPDYEKLQGVWEAKVTEDRVVAVIMQDESVLVLLGNGETAKGKFELATGIKPQFDITFEAKPAATPERWRGIYELSDKTFKAALSYRDDKPRPTEFTEQNTWKFEWKGKAKDLHQTIPIIWPASQPGITGTSSVGFIHATAIWSIHLLTPLLPSR